MSNTHYHGDDQTTLCGQCGSHCYSTTGDRASVTCKRCLASLAKRDREFQRKARKGMNSSIVTERQWLSMFAGWRDAHDAARAIAREEGRAL